MPRIVAAIYGQEQTGTGDLTGGFDSGEADPCSLIAFDVDERPDDLLLATRAGGLSEVSEAVDL